MESPSWKQLLELAQCGSADQLREFLSSGSVSINTEEPGSGVTAVCVAADAGNIGTTKILIELGADFKKPCTTNGNCPAHFAARKGHVEILQMYEESGLDLLTVRNVAVTQRIKNICTART